MACRRLGADQHRETAEALEELRLLAQGRSELLAQACGQLLGGFLAVPGAHHPADLQAPALLFEAGANPRLVTAHVDATRLRAGGHHTTSTTGGPANG